ncbi:MAG: hypothetical protein Kow00121_62310 [Elainellaceae cyanobacterium]
MKHKETFSKLEQWVQKIPTWLFIGGAVLLLSLVALWLEEDQIQSARDALKVLFENAESIAIVAAVIFFFKEAPTRKAQRHYEAWQVIDHAAAAHVPTSYARIQALQDLNQDGVSLVDLNLPGAHLQGIHLPDAVLVSADLREANLVRAELRGADFSRANLSGAILIDADLRGADLRGANLQGAILGIADLRRAILIDTDFSNANLIDADLRHSNLHGAVLNQADLCNTDLHGANLAQADLRQSKNITLQQIRSAHAWEKAIFDRALCKALGLPSHNNNAN